MMWRPVEYGHDDKGAILLPEGAPFDGEPVLIKTNTGIVEAWWDKGGGSDDTPIAPPEYEGWQWVCYDDQFQVDLDAAHYWMPIPPLAPVDQAETDTEA